MAGPHRSRDRREAPNSRDAVPGTAHVVARAGGVLLAAALLLAAQPTTRFTLGDSREVVRQVQGSPTVIERLTSLGVEHWSYERATVTFDGREGRVIGWNDPRRTLRVSLRPATTPHRPLTSDTSPLRLGDDRDAVVRRLGTPWAYARARGGTRHVLAYGNSVIRLRASDLTIDAWVQRDSTLPMAPDERRLAERAMAAVTAPAAEGEASAPRASGDAAAPPVLRADVTWRDADGDGVVAPRERLRVTVFVHNDGGGRARAVRPAIDVESPRGALHMARPPREADVAPSASHAFTFELDATDVLESSEVVLVVTASEGAGFDLAPAQRLRIPARASGAPRLVVRALRVDDPSRDGRLAPREVGDVTITISNTGDAPSGPLRARLLRGEDLFLAAGMPETFALGSIAPGASSDVSLTLYTNTRAARTDARLELRDPAGAIVARLAVVLPLISGGAALAVDAPANRDTTSFPTAPRTPRPLALDDVERALPRPRALRPDAVAVIIGIERYRHLPDARFAARDAALIRRYATHVLGVPDDDQHVIVRTDGEATGNELRRLFGEDGWLARRTDANTELFVFFAGHGAPDASGRTPYLLPADADGAFVSETGFALGALYDRLARLPARSITIALDACFSGLTREHRALVAGRRPGTLSIEHPALLRRNMAVFAAARDAQAAGDLADARHGAFTWYLARGLRGEADGDGDGAITVTELGSFVERGVRRAAALDNREQRPLTIARDSMRVLTRVLVPPAQR